MQQYADTVLPMIVKFFQASYRAMPPPKQYIYIPIGQQVQSACTGLEDDMAYAYCAADQKVYVGQQMLWKLYQDGDIGPAIGLAHEMGHNVQNYAHVPRGDTPAASVRYEDQADCVAGAWLQFAGSQGWLEPEDSLSAAKVLVDIASDAEPNRDHGDLEERSQSMLLGLRGGLPACNQFYPNTPIITAA